VFEPIIASRPREQEPRLASSGAAIAGHAVCLLALAWATLHSKPPARPVPPPLVLAWPDQTTTTAQTLPPRPDRAPWPDGLAWRIPVESPIDSPSIDAGTRFDPAEWLRGRDVETSIALSGAGPDSGIAPFSDEPPALLTAPRPAYPELLRAAGIAGRVVVETVIDTSGRAEPGSVVVVASTNPGFDAPARASVSGATFRPARLRGHSVRVRVRVPIVFTLAPAGR
jgi:periplasmic protein TonB